MQFNYKHLNSGDVNGLTSEGPQGRAAGPGAVTSPQARVDSAHRPVNVAGSLLGNV